METPESDPFDDPEATDDDESAEDFAADVEDDPSRNPDDDELEDLKGG